MNERPTMRQANDRKYVLYFNIVQNIYLIGENLLMLRKPIKIDC